MKHFCKFLMGIIGLGFFFLMMIKGWGLSVKAVWPIVIYYIYWFITLVIHATIEKMEERKRISRVQIDRGSL